MGDMQAEETDSVTLRLALSAHEHERLSAWAASAHKDVNEFAGGLVREWLKK